MFKLIKNEFKTLIFRKKTLYVLMGLIAFFLLIGIQQYKDSKMTLGYSDNNLQHNIEKLNRKMDSIDVVDSRDIIDNSKNILADDYPIFYYFNAVTYIETIYQYLGMIFLAMGLAIFLTDRKKTENTNIEPIYRGKTILAKYVTWIIASISLVCSLELIAFLIVGVIYGFGDLNHSVMEGLPVYKLLFQGLLMQILFIVACVSLILMLSTIFKDGKIIFSIMLMAAFVFTF